MVVAVHGALAMFMANKTGERRRSPCVMANGAGNIMRARERELMMKLATQPGYSGVAVFTSMREI